MSHRYSHVIIHVILMAAAMVIFTTGCGDSTRPDSDGQYQDVPSVPKPTAPGAETGAYSDTLTVVSRLATNYRPMVTDMYAVWTKLRRCAQSITMMGCPPLPSEWPDIWNFESWISIPPSGPTWSSQPLMLTMRVCNLFPPLLPVPPVPVLNYFPPDRHLLYEEGKTAGGPRGEVDVFEWANECRCTTFPPLCSRQAVQYKAGYEGFGLSSAPQLRRDRFWVRRPLEGGVGNFLLLIGDTQGEITTTYTSGSSTEETEEFGRTVTASAGLDFGKLSLGVEVSISRTFRTSVTVSNESSESFTKTVFGEDGKIVHFQVWELVERYTITDTAGKPFTDPAFVFEPVEFHIHGVAVALDATKFDQ